MDSTTIDQPGRDALLKLLRAPHTQNIIVITGAGISVASGITPFRRAANAIWETSITEMGTYSYFRAHPVESWRWYLDRFAKTTSAAPNAGHRALVDLAAWAEGEGRTLTLITQNVDGLHIAAGSKTIEVHGSAQRVRCASRARTCPNAEPGGTLPLSDFDLAPLMASGDAQDLPRCPACGDLIRPHVLWFDESYSQHQSYRYDEAEAAQKRGDLFLFVGTSFAVGITASALYHAEERGAPVWAIDPSPMDDDEDLKEVSWVGEASEVALPALVSALRG